MEVTTVILPTYNEANNIGAIIDAIRSVRSDLRILVVDDNSPDRTADVVKRISERDLLVSLLLRERKEGLGKAYIHAFRKVLADLAVKRIVTMDADFSHDPRYLPELLAAAESVDICIGSRYVPGGGTQNWEPWRRFISKLANRYCRAITGMPHNDTTAGFMVIRTEALAKLRINALDNSGYAFLIELKYLLWKSGATFVEVPIVFKARREGESKMSSHIMLEGALAPWKMLWKH